ncbi:sugar phosphate isomerase/epimerase family protein [Rhizobium leguminosarum]|uniref:sugar phosphate isomerase/epimerase family protein n=1 Tax=Rhizobium leguminosarum TaxID=384 RepID=UPI0014417AB8|nr:sugar phosphate isomerase/epimerase [Rhizobium leguminosarum]
MTISNPFSFQIFSAREFPPVSDQLKTISSLGFCSIEAYRALYDEPEAIRAQLDENGLTAPTGHFALTALEDEFERHVDAARILGIKRIIVPSLPFDERDKDIAGWQDIGRRLDVLRQRVVDIGFTFGWHNHAFEFVGLPDGSFPIEHILGDTIDWQMDVAWVAKAGHDPIEWMQKYSDRIVAIHVKDLALEGENESEMGWADPGKGRLPWDEYWKAAEQAGATIAIAEHDHPSDYERFAKNAIAKLQQLANGDAA